MSRKAAASKIVRAIGIEIMHKQAYIRDGHVDARAEERGAIYGGFRERRSVKGLRRENQTRLLRRESPDAEVEAGDHDRQAGEARQERKPGRAVDQAGRHDAERPPIVCMHACGYYYYYRVLL
jgi:hypothetical protein